MIVHIDKSFERDVKKIKDSRIQGEIANCIKSVISASSVGQIKSLKKLQGGEFYFRIRINNYRIGLIVEENEITFVRFLHRKDIYKYFPS